MFFPEGVGMYQVLAALVYPTLIFLLLKLILLPFWSWLSAMRIMKDVPGPWWMVPFHENIRLTWGMLKDGFQNEANYVGYKLRLDYERRFAKEGIFKTTAGFIPIVVLLRQETIEPLLNSSTLLTKSLVYTFLKPWLGEGLLVSTGSKWRQRRKMLTPAFHFRILEDFLPVMNEHSQIFVERIKSFSKEPFVSVIPLVSFCTLDIICETAMGVRINAQLDNNSAYVKAVNDFTSSAMQRIFRPLLWQDFIFKRTDLGRRYYSALEIMHDFTNKVIQKKKQEFVERSKQSQQDISKEDQFIRKKRQAFLDLLLTQHFSDDSFTEDDMREEVDTFMFEGHDTTAMGVSWTLYLLGLHPEVQKKAQEELDGIFTGDTMRYATTDDLRNMKYLECIIKEAQRLYPSVPAVARVATEDLKINGYTIPKGAMVNVSIYTVHRDERNYPDPEAFKPERFMTENVTGRNPFAYVPFSAGPRNCIGQKFAINEEKIMVSTVLRNFNIKSLDTREETDILPELVLRPRQALRLHFTQRPTGDEGGTL